MLNDYRQAARGQECTLRLAPKCSGRDTTIFAHCPSKDDGTGIKSPPWWGAFACHACHELIDRRGKIAFFDFHTRSTMQRWAYQDEINEAWLRGIYATQKICRNNEENVNGCF